MFAGRKFMSAFQLARVYTLSIAGIPSKVVSSDLLTAYKLQAEIRALQELLHSHNYTNLSATFLKTEGEIVFFYKSTKNSERSEW